MDKLTVNILNRIQALNQEKEFSMVELEDKETGQILGYVYEKDLIKFWKGKLKTENKEPNY